MTVSYSKILIDADADARLEAIRHRLNVIQCFVQSDALSEDEKQRYASLRVVHSLEASQRRVTPDPTPEQLAQWRARRTHEHPLVWTHQSGRKSLVLGASADYIVGMDIDEGRLLLAELLDRQAVPVHVNVNEALWVSRVTGIGLGDLTTHENHDKVSIGDIEIELLHTPGHTPGSQCFLLDGRLVKGQHVTVSVSDQGAGAGAGPGSGTGSELEFVVTDRLPGESVPV